MSPYGPVVDHLHAVGSEPSRNVGRVEANEVTDLDKGNPPLGDESPKVPLGGTQRLRDLLHPKEFGRAAALRRRLLQARRRIRRNTVSLRSENHHRLLRRPGWPGPVSMLRALHGEVRHLALHDPWVGAQATGTEGLEEDLFGRLALRLVKIPRGKNPGGSPSCGVPPGALG